MAITPSISKKWGFKAYGMQLETRLKAVITVASKKIPPKTLTIMGGYFTKSEPMRGWFGPMRKWPKNGRWSTHKSEYPRGGPMEEVVNP